jgi:hypothetical protein
VRRKASPHDKVAQKGEGQAHTALELWGQTTLAELWVFHEAAREALTPRQRAVVAARGVRFDGEGKGAAVAGFGAGDVAFSIQRLPMAKTRSAFSAT